MYRLTQVFEKLGNCEFLLLLHKLSRALKEHKAYSLSSALIFSLLLSSSLSSTMDEIKSKETKKPRNRSKAICRKTGDHVHYPPTRRTKPTRPTHAPLPNLKSSFRFPDKEPPRYGKCRKNQAAGIGTTAYDGCGEFVSAIPGEEDSLNCAACGCHRIFHREDEEEVKEEEEESILERCINSGTIDDSVLEMLKISSCQFRQIFCSPYGDRRKRKSNGEEELVKEEEEEKERVVKRLKTKFTEEQTEKMRSYAEKLRWKMSSENGNEVDEFCVEIGVNRKNFRIWMNNHKDKN